MSLAGRSPGLIAMLALPLLLTACGGGDEQEMPGGAPESLATPAQVRAHLTFVLALMPLRAEPDEAVDSFTCTSGGTREVTQGSTDSPFSRDDLPVESILFRDCQQYSGPASAPQSSFARRHGLQESGAATQPNGTRIRYAGQGADFGTPLEVQTRSELPNGIYQEDHFTWSRLHHSDRAGFLGLFRSSETRLATRHELSIRYPDGARFEGSYRVGSAESPFVFESRNSQWKLRGNYSIETERCLTGTLTVQSTQDLAYDAQRGRFTGGRLRFSADGANAEVQFNPDGRVRFVGAQGEELLEPWEPGIEPWNSECFGAR